MSIELRRPLWLLILIPLVAGTVVPFILAKRKRALRGRHNVSLVLRLTAVVLAALAVAGFSAGRRSDVDSVIIVADLSDSTRGVRALMEEAVRTGRRYSDRRTRVGLLTFGYNSYYEIPLTDSFAFDAFETAPDGNYTDIRSALVKASAMFPGDTSKRIILLTDGKENVGEYREAAAVLSQRGIRLDAVVYPTDVDDVEMQLTSVSTPAAVYSGESFNITVTAESSYEGAAEIFLYCDGVLSAKREVRLTKGTNRFVFRDTAEGSGITTYSAEIVADSDSLRKNNKVYSFISVLGTPRILIIDGTGSESHELTKLLGDGVDVDVAPPSAAPSDIAGLRKYKAVVMMNVQKSALPEGYDDLLDAYVRQLGRGLLVTGGDRSFALGGWEGSTLEKVLPVEMIVRDKEKLRDIGIMILIDNSGSMGMGQGSALELAKQGAINIAGIVKAIDSIGVIAFSDNAVWVSPMTPGTERETVQGKIASIPPGGGTMIYAAMGSAYEALKNSGKNLKNIILLTDGQPADGDQVFASGLLDKIADEGITVTSVAVGDSPDVTLLRRISSATGGDVCVAQNVNELPELLFTEAVKILNTGYINNETFTPTVNDYTSVLTDVKTIPELDGYVLAQPKDLAFDELLATEGDPILSTWQYGLGRSAALMTDLNGKWSSKLLASEDGRTLIRNLVSYVLPSDEEGEGSVNVAREGDRGVITAVSPVTDRTLPVTATVISPSGKERQIELVQTGLGEYRGEFLLEEEGSYTAVVTQNDENGNAVMNKEGGLAVRYSDEYDAFKKYDGGLSLFCRETGGSADWTDIAAALALRADPVSEKIEFTVPFLIAFLLLVLFDIAFRRLDLAAAVARVFGRRKKAPVKEPEPPAPKPAAAKEKTEIAAPPPKEKKKQEKEEKKTPAAPPPSAAKESSSASALLKEKKNMSRKKM